MSDRKCVSAKLVFDDGMVELAEGEEAELVDGVLRHECIDRSYWTTTRPLRKVTVLPRACHGVCCEDDHLLWKDRLTDGTLIVKGMGLMELVPAEIRGSQDDWTGPREDDEPIGGPPGAWRIEVEAVPEKEVW